MNRNWSIVVCGALTLCLLTACGTSTWNDSSQSDSALSSWETEIEPADTPETTQITTPEVTETETETETDVTAQYLQNLLGLWETEDAGETYEFLENETLVITAGAESKNLTYWCLESQGQVVLCIYENGAQEEERYPFRLSGNTLVLYDSVSGNAAKTLYRQELEETEEVTPAATEPPAATATPTATAAPTATATPTATAAPTTTPQASAAPSQAPVAITTPVDTTVTVSEEVTLPQDVTNALPQVECVLDVVLDGIPFDETNSDSFWAILARYLSRQNESDEDGYFTVSPSQVSAAAKALFSGIETIPDCPENSDLAQSLDSGDYRLHWGVTGGHSLEVIDYDGDLVIEADGTTRYTVEVDGNGAVLSVGES